MPALIFFLVIGGKDFSEAGYYLIIYREGIGSFDFKKKQPI